MAPGYVCAVDEEAEEGRYAAAFGVVVVVAGGGGAAVGVETAAEADNVAGMGTTVTIETGGADVDAGGVLAGVLDDAALWRKAPPGIDGVAWVATGSALELVEAGGGGEAALDPPADPEEPDEKVPLPVRVLTVPDWQELGPEAQPMRRLATSEA